MDPLTSAGEPPSMPRRPRPRRFMMGFLGGIFGFAGLILADGYGRPTIDFVLIGILLGVLGAGWDIRHARGWRSLVGRRLVLLGVIFLVSMGQARYSVRVDDPAGAFQQALGLNVPAGVSDLHAWRQFFDGTIDIISFTASEQTIQSILAVPGYQYEEEENYAKLLRD